MRPVCLEVSDLVSRYQDFASSASRRAFNPLNLARHQVRSSSTAPASGSGFCWRATWDFAGPRDSKRTATREPSPHARLIVRGGVPLLRAVGLSRRQLRTMLRLESVAIAVLGAVLGIVLGLAFAVALQRSLIDDGIDVLAIPGGQLALFVAAAAVVGVLAALWPGRRAARLDVLRAIASE